MKKFEHVSSLGHQMSQAGEGSPCTGEGARAGARGFLYGEVQFNMCNSHYGTPCLWTDRHE